MAKKKAGKKTKKNPDAVQKAYGELAAEVKAAQTLTKSTYWKEQFKRRQGLKVEAYKKLNTVCSEKIENISGKKELKGFKDALKKFVKAVTEMEDFVRDLVFDVDALADYIWANDLFKDSFPKIAKWDAKTGRISFVDYPEKKNK